MANSSGYSSRLPNLEHLKLAYDSAPATLKDPSNAEVFPVLPDPKHILTDRNTVVIVQAPYWDGSLGQRPAEMGFEPGVSRLFTVANLAAHRTFGYTDFVLGLPGTMIGLDGRLSAPLDQGQQTDRKTLFNEVNAIGFAFGYSGTRISKSGATFKISGAAVWKVHQQGKHIGEAASFRTAAIQR